MSQLLNEREKLDTKMLAFRIYKQIRQECEKINNVVL